MGYYEFTINIADESRDAVSNRLSEMGCLGSYEKGESLVAYFPDRLDIVKLRDEVNALRTVLKDAGLDHEFSFDYAFIAERDWNESWKKSFLPIDLGENLSIVPPWDEQKTGRTRLIVDPGMAFGTGHHETTSRCLMLIEKLIKQRSPEDSNTFISRVASSVIPACRESFVKKDPGQAGMTKRPLSNLSTSDGLANSRFLDVGTGTGILAIAASKLGFKEVVGVDTDPLAVDAAVRNAGLNGLEGISISEGGISSAQGAFDMIAANLMSEILIGIAPEIARRLNPSGVVILSGMLTGQEEGVIAAMAKEGLTMIEKFIDDRWVSLVLGR